MAKKNSFLPLWLLLSLFLAPALSAFIIHLLNKEKVFSTTQHGMLIEPFYLPLNQVRPNLRKNWNLVFIEPKICNSNCQNKKRILSNLHIALGKDQTRVKVLSIAEVELLEHNKLFTKEGILILNPKGIAIMYYAADSNPSGILKDLRKLLKNSRV